MRFQGGPPDFPEPAGDVQADEVGDPAVGRGVQGRDGEAIRRGGQLRRHRRLCGQQVCFDIEVTKDSFQKFSLQLKVNKVMGIFSMPTTYSNIIV